MSRSSGKSTTTTSPAATARPVAMSAPSVPSARGGGVAAFGAGGTGVGTARAGLAEIDGAWRAERVLQVSGNSNQQQHTDGDHRQADERAPPPRPREAPKLLGVVSLLGVRHDGQRRG